MSRYLVTGATGYLGAHLVAGLAAAGHDVVALARRAAPSASDARVTWRRGDVLDAASLRDAATGCDGLFHCAGRVSRKPEDAEALQRVHVEGNKVTLDACKAAGVKRAVVASTSGTIAVSRDPGAVLDEHAPEPFDLVAGWPYYRSKLYAERAALERSAPDFEVVVVNPSLLLGPVHDAAVVAKGAASTDDVVDFLERRVPFVPAGGISFVDARDAADGMQRAMERGRAGERYLLTGANMTLAAFFGRLARISGVPAPRIKLTRSVALASAGAELMARVAKRFDVEPPVDRISAEMAQHFWYADASKAKRELGFAPRDPGETLADTIADLERRGVVWPRA
ncbi:MAG TPA: NAD-dependent epimerase/dehydratase family protein [Byssovorax sp.]|jgi:dihydroflavonol-4-reductase